MLNQWSWALPIAMVAAVATQEAAAQALPVAEMNPVTEAAGALPQAAASAAAPTFSQLSAPGGKHPAAVEDATPADTDREGLWLPLAGAAALAFVARRNRRAFHTSPHPKSA